MKSRSLLFCAVLALGVTAGCQADSAGSGAAPGGDRPGSVIGTAGSGGAAAQPGGSTVVGDCGTALEGDSLSLACPSGQVVTGIVFASYGTPDGACGSFAIGSCDAAGAAALVAQACVGKTSCSVAATNARFGEPCVGVDKRLSVQATCGDTGSAGTTGSGGTGSGGRVSGAGGSGSGGAGSGGAGSGGTGSGGRVSGAGGSGSGGTGSGGAVTSATGTIVPLYTNPGDSSWSAIVAAKRAHPSVPVVAVVNPNNGPGSSASSSYSSGIASLAAAGIQVIGYVYTGYGSRDSAQVRADIDRWHSWYPEVSGIFFDEESNSSGVDGYYRALSSYAKSVGLPLTVGNPGCDTTAAYVDAMDVTLIYESAGLPSASSLGGWHTSYPPQRFGVIPYGVALNTSWVQQVRAGIGYIYLTSDSLPNPWDSLPSYFASLLAALE